VAGGGSGPQECQPTAPEDGYRSLFDGTSSSLAHWHHAGPGSFTLQDDCTLMSAGGLGLLSFDEEFNAYSLKVDWKVAGDDNSGVFVGYPEVGDDPWVAVNQGYEIQIDATDADEKTTGSIYSFQSADLPARDAALHPPGEWNSYEIVVQGQTIKVNYRSNLKTYTPPGAEFGGWGKQSGTLAFTDGMIRGIELGFPGKTAAQVKKSLKITLSSPTPGVTGTVATA